MSPSCTTSVTPAADPAADHEAGGGQVSTAVYSNELEQQFSRLPGFLQSVLRDPFNWVDGVLKDIAGQPGQLVSAGQAYAGLGQQIQQLGSQQQQDRTSIVSGAYAGASYDAFSAKMIEVEQRISSLGQATGQTQQLLDGAAQACAESASMIVSIVEGTISFILQDAVVSGVLSFFTFGAAAAAGAAVAAAKFATACEEVGGIVARLTTVLEKIAVLFEKIATICQDVVGRLNELQAVIKGQKGIGNLITKAKLARSGINVAVRSGAGYAVDGGPIPGPVGGGVHAGADAYQGAKDALGARHR
jgi:uncharacterized protein YukE